MAASTIKQGLSVSSRDREFHKQVATEIKIHTDLPGITTPTEDRLMTLLPSPPTMSPSPRSRSSVPYVYMSNDA
jgi:hypothetical protein